MASVTSLDQDMKRLRTGRYTPEAANEVRSWIEEVLGERLPPGDLLQALKDGTVLCRLVNLAVPTPVKFKKSAMPFIQMENISQFLRACEMPPLNMHSHDRFLTVDLFEAKDPAQVLQCLGALSRAANNANPDKFPNTIGPRRALGPLSPAKTGDNSLKSPGLSPTTGGSLSPGGYGRSGSTTFNPLSRPEGALTPHLTGGSNSSWTSRTSNGIPKSPPGGVSSWSKKTDHGATAPAWNIAQYGYMGGASQGNQGVAFGARRQITTAGPNVPTSGEKERRRKETEEAEGKRRFDRAAEEEQARIEEERLWEEESRKQREAKQHRLDKQKREWEEQERQWKLEEEERQREEQDAQEKIAQETRRKRAGSDARLKGQHLAQYQTEQATKPRSRRNSQYGSEPNTERDRIRELERQLEEAKERERQYQQEREERSRDDERRKLRSRSKSRTRDRSRSRPRPQPPPRAPSPQDSTVSWAQADDSDYLRKPGTPERSPRPLPEPTTSPRPLPDPSAYAKQNRTDRYLASNPAPASPKPKSHIPPELTSTSERAAEDARRAAAAEKTKAMSWASKSLLEREMERERQRQKEWEQTQRDLQNSQKDPNAGTGEGKSWDVNQYGYMGGDSQNKGGISFGGKRQILGPRPFGPK